MVKKKEEEEGKKKKKMPQFNIWLETTKKLGPTLLPGESVQKLLNYW